MSGKFNNRSLLIILGILVAIFVITRFTSKQSERTLRTDIVQIDTSQVSSILLYPSSGQGAELKFQRSGDSWSVSNGEITAAADLRSVNSTLGELQGLSTEQLVARSRDSWTEYSVTDSLGTRVVVKEGSKTTLDLVVGRFHYQPPPQNSYNPYAQNRVSGKTYVRLSGEDEVYSVEGFLAMSLNQNFERWRDQAVTRINTSRLSKIIYDYPADSGFVAEKTDAGNWLVGGLMADSASMATFLNSLGRKSHSGFSDGFQPAGEADYRVSFEGDNMKPQQVSAFVRNDSMLVLHSSINPESWFSVKGSDAVFTDLFPSASSLLPGEVQ
jgi:hypothetical protein